MYSSSILDHYRHPRNFGEMPNYDKLRAEYSPACGDKIVVYLKLTGDKIKEVKFTGKGCAISIASMSLLSSKLVGQKLNEVRAWDFEKMKQILGVEVNPGRLKCAMLGLTAVKNGMKE